MHLVCESHCLLVFWDPLLGTKVWWITKEWDVNHRSAVAFSISNERSTNLRQTHPITTRIEVVLARRAAQAETAGKSLGLERKGTERLLGQSKERMYPIINDIMLRNKIESYGKLHSADDLTL